MKKLFILLSLFLPLSVLSQTDSTRIKSYENYIFQIDSQIKDTENAILELQKQLLQLQGAKLAFEAVLNDEKKRLKNNGNN